jgi:hypothetical protein
MGWFSKKKKKLEDPIDHKDMIEDVSTWEAKPEGKATTAKEYLEEAIASAKEDYYGDVLDVLPDHFVQYVIDCPDSLRSYVHGLNIGKHITMSVMANIVGQISKEIDMTEIDPDSTLANVKYSIKNGFLPIYNDHYDSEFCSVLYNGIMPDGQVIDIVNDSQDKVSKYKTDITEYLSVSDPVPTPITPEYLELRMNQYNNFFNVTCDKCGTPHGFKADVPEENFNCTLCDNELVVYTTQLFKEGPYEECSKRIR